MTQPPGSSREPATPGSGGRGPGAHSGPANSPRGGARAPGGCPARGSPGPHSGPPELSRPGSRRCEGEGRWTQLLPVPSPAGVAHQAARDARGGTIFLVGADVPLETLRVSPGPGFRLPGGPAAELSRGGVPQFPRAFDLSPLASTSSREQTRIDRLRLRNNRLRDLPRAAPSPGSSSPPSPTPRSSPWPAPGSTTPTAPSATTSWRARSSATTT